MRRLREVAAAASITASLFCINQVATARACEPYDGSCGYYDPNPHTGGPGWVWGNWYNSGWYDGHYWAGGPWYGHW